MIAAIERFMRDTAPPVDPAPAGPSPGCGPRCWRAWSASPRRRLALAERDRRPVAPEQARRRVTRRPRCSAFSPSSSKPVCTYRKRPRSKAALRMRGARDDLAQPPRAQVVAEEALAGRRAAGDGVVQRAAPGSWGGSISTRLSSPLAARSTSRATPRPRWTSICHSVRSPRKRTRVNATRPACRSSAVVGAAAAAHLARAPPAIRCTNSRPPRTNATSRFHTDGSFSAAPVLWRPSRRSFARAEVVGGRGRRRGVARRPSSRAGPGPRSTPAGRVDRHRRAGAPSPTRVIAPRPLLRVDDPAAPGVDRRSAAPARRASRRPGRARRWRRGRAASRARTGA